MHAGGGLDAFLDEHAVIVLADHSHARRRAARSTLRDAFARAADVLAAAARRATPRDAAEHRGRARRQRAAMVYVLDDERRDAARRARRARRRGTIAGVDLVMRRDRAARGRRSRASAASCASRPAATSPTCAARAGASRASSRARRARRGRPPARRPTTPTRSARVWSALTCPTAGDVLLSAAPGYEFVDWGGADHVGGGSHGSLHRSDSLGALLWCGDAAPDARDAREQWTIAGRAADGDRALRARTARPGAMRDERRPRRARYPVPMRDDAIRRRAAAAPPRAARHAPAGQLAAARALRARRRERLRRQPRDLRAAVHAARDRLPDRRGARVPRRGHEQLLVEPPLDVRRARRPRRLPGGALPGRQRRARSCFTSACCELLVEARGLPEVPAQAIAIVAATPLNFVGNKLWSFRR